MGWTYKAYRNFHISTWNEKASKGTSRGDTTTNPCIFSPCNFSVPAEALKGESWESQTEHMTDTPASEAIPTFQKFMTIMKVNRPWTYSRFFGPRIREDPKKIPQKYITPEGLAAQNIYIYISKIYAGDIFLNYFEATLHPKRGRCSSAAALYLGAAEGRDHVFASQIGHTLVSCLYVVF